MLKGKINGRTREVNNVVDVGATSRYVGGTSRDVWGTSRDGWDSAYLDPV